MAKNNSWIWICACIGCICLFLYTFGNIVFPFLFGALLAYVFAPIVDKFEKYCPRTLISIIITLMFICFFAFLVISITPKIEAKISDLISLFPNYSEQIFRSVNLVLTELSLEQIDISSLQAIIIKNVDLIINFILKIFAHGDAITSFFSCLIVIPVTMFYLMRDWKKLVLNIMNNVPYRFANLVEELSYRVRHCLWHFFRGQLCAAIILAAYYSIALVLLSLNHAIMLGIITGLMSFIPFIGAVCCGITAFIIGVINEFSFTKLAIIAAIYTIGPLLESYVITPRFVGEKVGLHPLWILFAFFAGIQLYGIIGVAVAIPCASVIAEIIRYVVQQAKKSMFFKA